MTFEKWWGGIDEGVWREVCCSFIAKLAWNTKEVEIAELKNQIAEARKVLEYYNKTYLSSDKAEKYLEENK